MQQPKHDLTRMNFQVERFITFSDGVFAISITIMIFEIKVPELIYHSDLELWNRLSKMGLKFLGFFISFGIVGHYWSVHHRIFGYAQKYSTSLLWINLGFLLTVVVLPFSSALLGDYSSYTSMRLPYAVYAVNMCLTGLMNCWMWIYISNPKRDLLTRKISKSRIKLGVYRSLVIPIIFFLSLMVSFLFPVISRIMLLLIPVILLWGMGALEKRSDLEEIPVVIPDSETIQVPNDENKELA